MFRFLSKAFGFQGKSAPAKTPISRPKRSTTLAVEQLETRLVPVVGANATAAAVAAGTGYDGVVQLNLALTTGNFTCSGTLLSDGRHVLSAAHCFDGDQNGTRDGGTVSVQFDMQDRQQAALPARQINTPNIQLTNVTLHPSWNGNIFAGNDIALISLPEVAPVGAERYQVYRGSSEVGQNFTLVGYGNRGVGATGQVAGTAGTKRSGQNRWDADANRLGAAPMSIAGIMGTGLGLAYDFDNGQAQNDAFGSGYTINNTGLGNNEAMQAPGDSGGPAFIGTQVSGVVSFSRQRYGNPPDVDATGNNTFGEFAVMTRVSAFATNFIDPNVGGPYALVVDMNNQPSGNNGIADSIQVEQLSGQLRVFLNGQLLISDAVSNITSLTIRGSNDDEDFIIYRDGAPMPMTLDGRGGSDDLSIYGTSSDDTVTLTTGRVTFNGVQINYTEMQTLYVRTNAGNDTITVNSTSAQTPVTVSGWDGDDIITVGNHLNNIQSDVTVYGGNNNDRLTVSDQLWGGGDNYTIWNNHVRLAGLPVRVYYSYIENLVLATGNGADVITIGATQAGTTTTVRAGGGDDTINGDATNNILLGEGGNDIINGGGGRDVIIGGDGIDTINGGAGEDLLIDGTTLYDNDLPALLALMTEWGRTDANSSYGQRIINLRNGVVSSTGATVRLVEGTTVFHDMYVDALTGGDDMDWFWAENRFSIQLPWLPPPLPRDTLPDWWSTLFASESVN